VRTFLATGFEILDFDLELFKKVLKNLSDPQFTREIGGYGVLSSYWQVQFFSMKKSAKALRWSSSKASGERTAYL
jgi:hypothetical protein